MAKHPTISKLLADIEAYRARHGTDRTTFGRAAVSDGHFIARVERGTVPRLGTIARVYRFMNRKKKRPTT